MIESKRGLCVINALEVRGKLKVKRVVGEVIERAARWVRNALMIEREKVWDEWEEQIAQVIKL